MTDTWQTPRVWVAGEKVTASKKNDESMNFRVLFPHTTGGDFAYRDPAGAYLTRLALGGAAYYTMKVKAGGLLPEWAPFMEGCTLYKTATQNVSTASETVITFDTELIDDKGWHSTSVNTDRITVTENGRYLPFGAFYFTHAGGSGDYRAIGRIKVDGTDTANKLETAQIIDANPKNFVFGGIPLVMTAGQYVTMSLYHTRGATATVYGTDKDRTSLTLLRIG